eukprot:7347295-Prymnesium_polylepis.2
MYAAGWRGRVCSRETMPQVVHVLHEALPLRAWRAAHGTTKASRSHAEARAACCRRARGAAPP